MILASLDLSELRETHPELDETLESLSNSVKFSASVKQLHQDLVKLVESPEAPDWIRNAKADESLETVEAFEADLDEFQENGAHNDFLSTGVVYLTRFTPRSRYTYFFWRLMTYVEWKERPEQGESDDPIELPDNSFFPKLAQLAEQIPRGDDNYWDCKFTLATWYRNHRMFKENQRYIANFSMIRILMKNFPYLLPTVWGFRLKNRANLKRPKNHTFA